MVHRLDPHEDLRALPRLIAAEAGEARAALARVEREPVIAIHEARKAIKRARSGARLMRKADKAVSRSLNAQGRKAARALEDVRDADSLALIARVKYRYVTIAFRSLIFMVLAYLLLLLAVS
jgi:CHAD domain-containing protein